jgi:3-oxoacyl-[acyl-carrier-protein] synthase-3
MEAVLHHTEENPGFPITEGVRLALEGLRACVTDPFFGISQRRIMPKGMTSSDMEIIAAREAIQHSNIDPREIGLLLVHAMVPTYQTFNQATPIHHALNLAENCLCLGIDAVCNSFLAQLALARDFLSAGRARYALLVQSSSVSRICDYGEWYSAFLGDGATAVILGPVKEGRGLVGMAHRVDSRNTKGIVTGVSGAEWYEAGRLVASIGDKEAARRILFLTPDIAREAFGEVFELAGEGPESVDFLACHQVAGNLRNQIQRLVGMSNAKFVDTMPWAGTLSSANIPLQLSCGQRESLLREDDLVGIFGTGTGSTGSVALLRWGL